MTIDIYAGTKVFHLTDEPSEYHIQYTDRKHLKEIVDKFLEGFYTEVYVYHESINELFKNFKIFFTFIESAGGIVFNKYGQILFLRKSQIWDLPKGKIEVGETPQEAAIREVKEETGLDNLTIVNTLPSSYHIFRRGLKNYLKKIYWFKMVYSGIGQPRPLRTEGIVETRWFDRDQVPFLLDKLHPNLINLVKSVIS